MSEWEGVMIRGAALSRRIFIPHDEDRPGRQLSGVLLRPSRDEGNHPSTPQSIGESFNEKMRFKYTPKSAFVVCYQPSLYLKVAKRGSELAVKSDYRNVYSAIKNGSVGTKIGEKDCLYEAYDDRFWLYRPYEDLEVLEEKKGIVFCNGWVLPQYLMKENYMEA